MVVDSLLVKKEKNDRLVKGDLSVDRCNSSDVNHLEWETWHDISAQSRLPKKHSSEEGAGDIRRPFPFQPPCGES